MDLLLVAACVVETPAIRDARDRLLMLHHASTCRALTAKACPGGAVCQEMKQLWDHVRVCANPACPAPRCSTSKFVLAHYASCRCADCVVCWTLRQRRRAVTMMV